MGEKKTNVYWTNEEKELLQKTCKEVQNLQELKEKTKDLFPQHPSWTSIRNQACRHPEWTSHFNKKEMPKEEKPVEEIKEPEEELEEDMEDTDEVKLENISPKKEAENKKAKDLSEKILKFLLKPRDLRQIAEFYKKPIEEVKTILNNYNFGDYELHTRKSPVFGHIVYFLRRKMELTIKEKIWNFQRHSEKPYLIVNFPEDLGWKKINIVPISDVIFGSCQCDENLFDQYIQWLLSEPHAFTCLNGDILAPVPKKGVSKWDYDFLEYAYRLIPKLMPISHKILWAQQGDEEEKVFKSEGMDPLEFACEELGIPYFREPVYADIGWKESIFTFFCFHGRTKAIYKGTKLNAVLRSRDFQEHTMFTIMGHAEDGMVKDVIKERLDPISFKIIEQKEYYVICPSFKKFFGSDIAKKGYGPLSKGAISCRLYYNGKYQASS